MTMVELGARHLDTPPAYEQKNEIVDPSIHSAILDLVAPRILLAHECEAASLDTLHLLHNLPDPATIDHQARTALMFQFLARKANLPDSLVRRGAEISYIHDNGKADDRVAPLLYMGFDELMEEGRIDQLMWHEYYGAEKAADLGLPELYVAGIGCHHAPEHVTDTNAFSRFRVFDNYGPDISNYVACMRVAEAIDCNEWGHYLDPAKPKDIYVPNLIQSFNDGTFDPRYFYGFMELIHELESKQNGEWVEDNKLFVPQRTSSLWTPDAHRFQSTT